MKIRRLTFGGVAHLGERLNGIQEVESSILFVSTKRPVTCWQVFFYSEMDITPIGKKLAMVFGEAGVRSARHHQKTCHLLAGLLVYSVVLRNFRKTLEIENFYFAPLGGNQSLRFEIRTDAGDLHTGGVDG